MGCCDDCEDVLKFEKKFEEGIPYDELQLSENEFLRTFNSNVNENWLKWHWDAEDRTIETLNDTDWQFQFDDKLPVLMKPGVLIHLRAGTHHRVIKGLKHLEIKITKTK
jgi:hypothetical protein